MLFKLALRNILLHKNKTLVLGLVIGIGLFVLVVGNSFLDSATKGIEKTYTGSFTSHLAVVPDQGADLPMFAASPSSANGTSVIPSYSELDTFIESLPDVESATPQLDSRAAIQFQENPISITLIFGIDPEKYKKVFPDNLDLIQGSFLKPGQDGILLSESALQALKDVGAPHNIGDQVTLSARNDISGTKIHSVALRGVIRFRSANVFLSRISLCDAGTVQYLTGVNGKVSDASETDESAAAEENPEAAFESSTSLIAPTQKHGSSFDLLNLSLKAAPLPDSTAPAPASDAWTYLLIRLKNQQDSNQLEKSIQEYLSSHKIEARVQDWLATAGPLAQTAFAIKTIFNWLIVVLGLVALLIVMNTLAISVSERIPEIGTIRALGGSKEFVRALVTWETLLTTLIFGLAGICIGIAALAVMGIVGFHAPNEFLAVILGGRDFRPSLSFDALIQSLLMTFLVGWLASLYPVALATRVPPLRAIQAE